MEDFPVVLCGYRDAADALSAERVIGNPSRVGNHHDAACARFRRCQQHSRLVPRALNWFLREIVDDQRTRPGGMARLKENLVAGVISPAEPANDRCLLRKNQLLGIGVEIGELQAKAREITYSTTQTDCC